MDKESLKLKLDQYGMLYYHYLNLRNTIFPTAHQRTEKERHPRRLVFYSQFIKEGDLVFDIGANYGNRTAVFLELGAEVVAVEPQEHCLRYLKKKFGNKINIVPKVISFSEGEKKLFLPKSKVSSSSASLSEDWIEAVTKSDRFAKANWNDSVTIPSMTLDQLIDQCGQPKFCKIDVEGHEVSVLSGLSHPLASLSFEFTTPERKGQVFKSLELLNEIDSRFKFNFCVKEDLSFGNEQWLNYSDFASEVSDNPVFNTKGVFGDIYGKLNVG